MREGCAQRERKDRRSRQGRARRADFTPSPSLSLFLSLSRSHADWEKAAPFIAQTRTLTISAHTEEADGHMWTQTTVHSSRSLLRSFALRTVYSDLSIYFYFLI
ncbi:hypothetical protein CHARACLAT_020811 [Characodon lateralis]|uniref:Uncharacterized protein n=1 Tax=Characodon lateralis TaxID=208331 RepID=A0ABU7D018_9TELE|nr:hypothetical protein [Characodon lateralis]